MRAFCAPRTGAAIARSLLSLTCDIESLNQAFQKVSKLLNHVKMHKNLYITELSTAKMNYIDPRVVYSICKKYNIDSYKVYNNITTKKHEWASYINKYFVY